MDFPPKHSLSNRSWLWDFYIVLPPFDDANQFFFHWFSLSSMSLILCFANAAAELFSWNSSWVLLAVDFESQYNFIGTCSYRSDPIVLTHKNILNNSDLLLSMIFLVPLLWSYCRYWFSLVFLLWLYAFLWKL